MDWKDKFPRKSKPTYNELLEFFPDNIRELFLRFDQDINDKFRVSNNWQRYDNAAGWVYGYCRNYRCELLPVAIGRDCFYALGFKINDTESLRKALREVERVYNSGYEVRYANLTAKRREDQITRTKLRLEREKAEMTALTENLDLSTFNQFRWSKKVSRSSLLKLYQGDAKGILDEELLDDVGYTFFTRCMQAQDTRACLETGRLICHQCGKILSPANYTAVVKCSCGYSYTYREYRRHCNAVNMPGGRATTIFEYFTQKWPVCTNEKEKMMLIDWLIHQCHVSLMSGIKGRSVCVNLIEGSKKQISELIMQLAYGSADANSY